MPIVAGVDASTQSSTVELRDADSGALLGTGRAAHPETFPPVSEQHPAAWWSAIASAFAAAVQNAGVRSQEIRAISVGAQCHGLVLLDHRPMMIARYENEAFYYRTRDAPADGPPRRAHRAVRRRCAVPPPRLRVR